MPLNSAILESAVMDGGLPALELPGGRLIKRPNLEWSIHQVRWRWLLDSYEGGEAYRTATYGTDTRGMPIRNLVRHKREYPLPQDGGYGTAVGRPVGTDQAAQATDDDYEMRRARTPVPTFMGQAINEHLSKIYNQEVKRRGPAKLEAWWTDVDGAGTSIDQFMADTLAPLILTFGQIDVIVEHPPKPEGAIVASLADELRLGLDTAVVSYILPVNMMWWTVDRRDRYTECVVREIGGDGEPRFRYWDAETWVLFDHRGKKVEAANHGYSRVPIQRVFERRRPSCRFVGMPPYEDIAEIQREYYNRDSELVLSDTLQAHPVLQAPGDLLRADTDVPVGPSYVLPMLRKQNGDWQGYEFVNPPKSGSDSIRTNKTDLRDAADRAACLTKPAGSTGVTGQTVSQSGLSKRLDQSTGNELLGKRAKILQRAEEAIAELAADVLGLAIDPKADDAVKIGYPGQFDLYDASELTAMTQGYELLITQVGDVPTVEKPMLDKIVRLMLPGLDDEQYAEMDAAHDDLLSRKATERQQLREAALTDNLAGPSAPGDLHDDEEEG